MIFSRLQEQEAKARAEEKAKKAAEKAEQASNIRFDFKFVYLVSSNSRVFGSNFKTGLHVQPIAPVE